MRAFGLARAVGAAAIATVTACSIWAAIDDPYKRDVVDDGGLRDAAAGGRRIVDAGFVPYALAVHHDTVYAVDSVGQIHVAYDASTNFTSFWTGDGGDTFVPTIHGIAASSGGVFWTISAGVRYCALDGGACGFLPSTNPGRIAAGDLAVAWLDSTGVRECPMPLDACNPVSLGASKNAASVAVGPTGTVAWSDGGKTIFIGDRDASAPFVLPYDVSLVATDEVSGALFFEGQAAIGFMQFDGGPGAALPMYSQTKPLVLFAANGRAYWSFRGSNGLVLYCRFDSGAGCSPMGLNNGLTPLPTASDTIVADSLHVLAIISSDYAQFRPTLVVWRLPP